VPCGRYVIGTLSAVTGENMRPTVIRFIVGGALGIAFSVSLMLPGTVVFPDDPPIRHLAAPDAPSTMVVQAGPIAVPEKQPAPRRVVVRPVYVPAIRTAPAASVVRHPPRRSKPAPRPVPRTSPPAQQRLTPLSAPPAERAKAKKPKKVKKEKDDENGARERDRGDRDMGKDTHKGKDKHKGKEKHKDRDKHKDDERDDDEGGGERGGDSVSG
jgi:hypothetical protein